MHRTNDAVCSYDTVPDAASTASHSRTYIAGGEMNSIAVGLAASAVSLDVARIAKIPCASSESNQNPTSTAELMKELERLKLEHERAQMELQAMRRVYRTMVLSDDERQVNQKAESEDASSHLTLKNVPQSATNESQNLNRNEETYTHSYHSVYATELLIANRGETKKDLNKLVRTKLIEKLRALVHLDDGFHHRIEGNSRRSRSNANPVLISNILTSFRNSTDTSYPNYSSQGEIKELVDLAGATHVESPVLTLIQRYRNYVGIFNSMQNGSLESLPSTFESFFKEAIAEIITLAIPDAAEDRRRTQALQTIRSAVRRALCAQVFSYGDFALKTYFPGSQLEISAFFSRSQDSSWIRRLSNTLCHDASAPMSNAELLIQSMINSNPANNIEGESSGTTSNIASNSALSLNNNNIADTINNGKSQSTEIQNSKYVFVDPNDTTLATQGVGQLSNNSADSVLPDPQVHTVSVTFKRTVNTSFTPPLLLVPDPIDSKLPSLLPQEEGLTALLASSPALSSKITNDTAGAQKGQHAVQPQSTMTMLSQTISSASNVLHLVTCKVGEFLVKITGNRVSALSSTALAEGFDARVGENHLFKRSLLLCRLWALSQGILASSDDLVHSDQICDPLRVPWPTKSGKLNTVLASCSKQTDELPRLFSSSTARVPNESTSSSIGAFEYSAWAETRGARCRINNEELDSLTFTEGGMTPSMLRAMVLVLFNAYHSQVSTPFDFFIIFVSYFAQFDWDAYALTSSGPVLLRELREGHVTLAQSQSDSPLSVPTKTDIDEKQLYDVEKQLLSLNHTPVDNSQAKQLEDRFMKSLSQRCHNFIDQFTWCSNASQSKPLLTEYDLRSLSTGSSSVVTNAFSQGHQDSSAQPVLTKSSSSQPQIMTSSNAQNPANSNSTLQKKGRTRGHSLSSTSGIGSVALSLPINAAAPQENSQNEALPFNAKPNSSLAASSANEPGGLSAMLQRSHNTSIEEKSIIDIIDRNGSSLSPTTKSPIVNDTFTFHPLNVSLPDISGSLLDTSNSLLSSSMRLGFPSAFGAQQNQDETAALGLGLTYLDSEHSLASKLSLTGLKDNSLLNGYAQILNGRGGGVGSLGSGFGVSAAGVIGGEISNLNLTNDGLAAFTLSDNKFPLSGSALHFDPATLHMNRSSTNLIGSHDGQSSLGSDYTKQSLHGADSSILLQPPQGDSNASSNQWLSSSLWPNQYQVETAHVAAVASVPVDQAPIHSTTAESLRPPTATRSRGASLAVDPSRSVSPLPSTPVPTRRVSSGIVRSTASQATSPIPVAHSLQPEESPIPVSKLPITPLSLYSKFVIIDPADPTCNLGLSVSRSMERKIQLAFVNSLRSLAQTISVLEFLAVHHVAFADISLDIDVGEDESGVIKECVQHLLLSLFGPALANVASNRVSNKWKRRLDKQKVSQRKAVEEIGNETSKGLVQSIESTSNDTGVNGKSGDSLLLPRKDGPSEPQSLRMRPGSVNEEDACVNDDDKDIKMDDDLEEKDDILDGQLSKMLWGVQQARQFETPDLAERDIVDLVKRILLERGSVPVGRMGSLLHDSTNNHSLSAMLKEHYGGLKRFLETHSDVFYVGRDHPYNPHVFLLSQMKQGRKDGSPQGSSEAQSQDNSPEDLPIIINDRNVDVPFVNSLGTGDGLSADSLENPSDVLVGNEISVSSSQKRMKQMLLSSQVDSEFPTSHNGQSLSQGQEVIASQMTLQQSQFQSQILFDGQQSLSQKVQHQFTHSSLSGLLTSTKGHSHDQSTHIQSLHFPSQSSSLQQSNLYSQHNSHMSQQSQFHSSMPSLNSYATPLVSGDTFVPQARINESPRPSPNTYASQTSSSTAQIVQPNIPNQASGHFVPNTSSLDPIATAFSVVAQPMQWLPHLHPPNLIVSLDCKLIPSTDGIRPQAQRVSIVDFEGRVLYDRLIGSNQNVQTQSGGVNERVDTADLATVERDVAQIIRRRLVVGYNLLPDLQALLLTHPKKLLRDLTQCKMLCPRHPLPLRKLVQSRLGVTIRGTGRSSLENAALTMAVYKSVAVEWEALLAAQSAAAAAAATAAEAGSAPHGGISPSINQGISNAQSQPQYSHSHHSMKHQNHYIHPQALPSHSGDAVRGNVRLSNADSDVRNSISSYRPSTQMVEPSMNQLADHQASRFITHQHMTSPIPQAQMVLPPNGVQGPAIQANSRFLTRENSQVFIPQQHTQMEFAYARNPNSSNPPHYM